MRLLVDSHVLLWAVADPDRLSRTWRDRLESPDNDILFSAASIWELAIKAHIGRLRIPVSPDDIAAAAVHTGFVELPVSAAHAAGTVRLPAHHRDPFDRLLISQAIHEPARLVTADRLLRQYTDLVDLID